MNVPATLLNLALALAVPPVHASACRTAGEAEVEAVWEQWNSALKSGQAREVAALYAADAVLLPTLSTTPRQTPEARLAYFQDFLAKRPVGRMDSRTIRSGCNKAIATGLYTFTFGDGSSSAARFTYTYAWDGTRWLITSHHSSLQPDEARDAR
jgi:uncharacterized protein (TIGR02246 family)